jgi:hypothetical protein
MDLATEFYGEISGLEQKIYLRDKGFRVLI